LVSTFNDYVRECPPDSSESRMGAMECFDELPAPIFEMLHQRKDVRVRLLHDYNRDKLSGAFYVVSTDTEVLETFLIVPGRGSAKVGNGWVRNKANETRDITRSAGIDHITRTAQIKNGVLTLDETRRRNVPGSTRQFFYTETLTI